ncbi:MAG: hypothetical protein BGO77_00370 [Caedibacter sp. 37-49]|nr:MAG: hypothetical protein BGO77_00370 [Caedibacter sp. 37-49]
MIDNITLFKAEVIFISHLGNIKYITNKIFLALKTLSCKQAQIVLAYIKGGTKIKTAAFLSYVIAEGT